MSAISLSEFDYELPPEAIAQYPPEKRDSSRMLLLDRQNGEYADRIFAELPAILCGDELVVVNNSRVIPARLFCRRVQPTSSRAASSSFEDSRSPGKLFSSRIEVLLTRRLDANVWEALVRPGRKVRVGARLMFEGEGLQAEVVGWGEFGLRQLKFLARGDLLAAIERVGHIPLPPYICRDDEPIDRERYQTVFAGPPAAVAAPTAGLHFTPGILEQLRARGIEICQLTLEVGLGTFQPIHTDRVEDHKMHTEAYEIPEPVASAIAAACRQGRPVLAVGTTVVRALEDAAEKAAGQGLPSGTISPGRASAELFIRPGHRFAIVSQLLTNFHLPRSTLLMLVAAFAGRERVLAAYHHAVARGYRFYSYGDCMLMR